ncbi:hypothetical protein WA026_005579 [Henosepilachna vigintioctopunctata]|uniref:Mannosyltransferase n=1 Tax=Henosepilachna vigintioctopunctata TaxID=420089 RepID=A0AAW1U3C4_9CUCU
MTWNDNSATDVFKIFVFVRIASVFLVQTFYEADEYWQSLEVAHNFVFGYGSLTWEWQIGVRSYVYPLVFSGLYKILDLFAIDTSFLIINGPRILQGILSAYADVCLYKWSGSSKWALFCSASSWFLFYMGSRTLINSFETSISSIALSMFPWPGGSREEKFGFLWLVGFICIVRPTAIIMWLPICLFHLKITRHRWSFLIFTKYLPIGTLLLMTSTIIDSIGHGSLILSFYQFFKFNVTQQGASFYGVLPWHWYMSVGLPSILGINLMPFVLASLVILKTERLIIMS